MTEYECTHKLRAEMDKDLGICVCCRRVWDE